MTRVGGGGLGRNPFGNVGARGHAGQAQETPSSLQGQLERELFGKRKPPREVAPDSADMEARLAWLSAWTKKLARFAGDADDTYSVRLAQDTIAMIDAKGVIFMGLGFLKAHADHDDVVLGVLAHEVGHRPTRWAQLRATAPQSADDVARLSRLEETRADHFAGRAMAAFARSVEPMCALLMSLDAPGQNGMHDYFPATVRCEVIREGFEDGHRQDALKRSMFPELAKLSGKHDLGMG